MKHRLKQWVRQRAWNLFVRMFFLTGHERGYRSVANRQVWIVTDDYGYELTLTRRDVNLPDAYAREEVYEMLCKVREAEREQGWKCPEPIGGES